ncbi:cytochrome c/c1 heme-lyase [Apodospora peruviana]|uniref:Holocytochrome c-type synthase n=1 Tax=Apodospora peruviana TaxID=516989 RepID=A0AAE0HTH0_9PEZI|nr:cytochrome c/c1 heme-lyase [Apodospora peruviana]
MHTSDLLDTVLISHTDDQSPTPGKNSNQSRVATNASTNMKDAASAGDEDKCPVDHKTREIWLQQAREAQAAKAAQGGQPPQPTSAAAPAQQQTSSSWSSWASSLPSFFSRQPPTTSEPATRSSPSSQSVLDESRVISSIPRAAASPTDPTSPPFPAAAAAARPSNHEIETGASASGKWIYPSEKMFFEAMRRKGHSAANPIDMKTVVPIHNAVNERAWQEILRWEAPYNSSPLSAGGSGTDNSASSSGKCGGPRLHSFAGLSTKMSPKARINTLLGYTAPFDRHDWIVDRCGTQVEYVIDFYAGSNKAENAQGKLNFYLDVRPKLNTWEGVKMRFLKASGLV